MIYIVSTIMRSGSSMMMRILEEGGLPVEYEKTHIPDEDNPNGYYETKKLHNGYHLDKWDGILDTLEGKAIKVLCHLIDYLPRDRKYKIIYMTRDYREIIQSRRIMKNRKGIKDTKSEAMHLVEFDTKVKSMKEAVNNSDCMEFIEINYNKLMNNPRDEIKKVYDFIGLDLDFEKMCSVPDQNLYRNRLVKNG